VFLSLVLGLHCIACAACLWFVSMPSILIGRDFDANAMCSSDFSNSVYGNNNETWLNQKCNLSEFSFSGSKQKDENHNQGLGNQWTGSHQHELMR
jgi:hypothetical protein